jgi:hypothetical protein
MIRVLVPAKQLDLVLLKEELIAAGVPSWAKDLVASYVGDGKLALVLPNGADSTIVATVVTAHKDLRTPVQIKRADAAAVVDSDEAAAVFRKALVLSLSDMFNDLATRLIAKQNPRSWSPQQIRALLRAKIAELLPEA